MRVCIYMSSINAFGKRETAEPVEDPKKEPTLAVLNSWIRREHGEDLGLPRTLRDVLDAVQNQVLQLDVPIADTPGFFANIISLVKLLHRVLRQQKICWTLWVVVLACLYERINDLCDLESELRPGDWSARFLPVYGVDL